jgi:hypothetical protein
MDLKTLGIIPPWEWPEDAAETILKVLQDIRAGETDRSLAVELAGDSVVVDDDLCDALLSILTASGESEELRTKAAISLGPALEEADMDDLEEDEFEEDGFSPISGQTFEKIQATLYRLFSDESVPKELRRRILEASVRAPQEWHKNAVRDAYSSDEENWKLTAVFCMRYIRGFDKSILESLDSDDPEIHCEAVCAAGNWGVIDAWPHIAALIGSRKTEKDLLLAAIEAASYIHPLEVPGIVGHLLESKDEDIREAAHDAITMSEGTWGDDEIDDEVDDGDDLF